MLHLYFAIFDKRSNKFHPMFPAQDRVTAKRMVIAAMKPETMLYNYPEDYDLYEILTYNDDVGVVENSTDRYVDSLTNLRPLKKSLEESFAQQLRQESDNAIKEHHKEAFGDQETK